MMDWPQNTNGTKDDFGIQTGTLSLVFLLFVSLVFFVADPLAAIAVLAVASTFFRFCGQNCSDFKRTCYIDPPAVSDLGQPMSPDRNKDASS